MTSRYAGKKSYYNAEETYSEYMKERGVKLIRHYPTSTIRYPTEDEIAQMQIESHVWKVGDRFFKLADEHYHDPELWWVIAWFNQKPTESHVSLGEVLDIPFPLSLVLKIARF